MQDRAAISLWDSTAAEEDYHNPTAGDAEADVAIVGGGYTGLSTALHCAERGLSAHVIEAHHIGYGGSGRNVGLVNAGVWHPPAKVRQTLGEPHGSRFVQRFGEAPERVFALIEQHQIRCEAVRSGTLHAAHAPSGLADLRGRLEAWRRLGAQVRLLDAKEMEERTGTAAYVGGLWDGRAGTVNPMAFCRGLARAARGAGAMIRTGVRATGLRREGAGWIVQTDRGAVRARFVVLGTNAYTDRLWPGLSRVFTQVRYFQLATEPLGPQASGILPGGEGLWDTGRFVFSLRRDGAGRLIVGSLGRVIGGAEAGLSQRWAQRQLARLFPSLGPVVFEDAWEGMIALTPDHLPRICKLEDGVYTAIGYNGRGITTGTIFGAAMADLLTGADPEALPLPITGPEPAWAAPLMSRLYGAAFTANQLLTSF